MPFVEGTFEGAAGVGEQTSDARSRSSGTVDGKGDRQRQQTAAVWSGERDGDLDSTARLRLDHRLLRVARESADHRATGVGDHVADRCGDVQGPPGADRGDDACARALGGGEDHGFSGLLREPVQLEMNGRPERGGGAPGQR